MSGESDSITLQQKPQQSAMKGFVEYTKIDDVPANIIAISKDVYWTFKEEYDKTVWVSFQLWDYLTAPQKLFWCNFTKGTCHRVLRG